MPLEGFAFKKAAIGTNVHGTPHTIMDGKTGILVEPENHLQLGEAILEFLVNEQKRTLCGLEGHKMVIDVCNAEEMANNTLKTYEKLLS